MSGRRPKPKRTKSISLKSGPPKPAHVRRKSMGTRPRPGQRNRRTTSGPEESQQRAKILIDRMDAEKHEKSLEKKLTKLLHEVQSTNTASPRRKHSRQPSQRKTLLERQAEVSRKAAQKRLDRQHLSKRNLSSLNTKTPRGKSRTRDADNASVSSVPRGRKAKGPSPGEVVAARRAARQKKTAPAPGPVAATDSASPRTSAKKPFLRRKSSRSGAGVAAVRKPATKAVPAKVSSRRSITGGAPPVDVAPVKRPSPRGKQTPRGAREQARKDAQSAASQRIVSNRASSLQRLQNEQSSAHKRLSVEEQAKAKAIKEKKLKHKRLAALNKKFFMQAANTARLKLKELYRFKGIADITLLSYTNDQLYEVAMDMQVPFFLYGEWITKKLDPGRIYRKSISESAGTTPDETKQSESEAVGTNTGPGADTVSEPAADDHVPETTEVPPTQSDTPASEPDVPREEAVTTEADVGQAEPVEPVEPIETAEPAAQEADEEEVNEAVPGPSADDAQSTQPDEAPTGVEPEAVEAQDTPATEAQETELADTQETPEVADTQETPEVADTQETPEVADTQETPEVAEAQETASDVANETETGPEVTPTAADQVADLPPAAADISALYEDDESEEDAVSLPSSKSMPLTGHHRRSSSLQRTSAFRHDDASDLPEDSEPSVTDSVVSDKANSVASEPMKSSQPEAEAHASAEELKQLEDEFERKFSKLTQKKVLVQPKPTVIEIELPPPTTPVPEQEPEPEPDRKSDNAATDVPAEEAAEQKQVDEEDEEDEEAEIARLASMFGSNENSTQKRVSQILVETEADNEMSTTEQNVQERSESEQPVTPTYDEDDETEASESDGDIIPVQSETSNALDLGMKAATSVENDGSSSSEEEYVPVGTSDKEESEMSELVLTIPAAKQTDAEQGALGEHTDLADMGGEADDNEWACSACTFLNPERARFCEMCETRKPGTLQNGSTLAELTGIYHDDDDDEKEPNVHLRSQYYGSEVEDTEGGMDFDDDDAPPPPPPDTDSDYSDG